MTRPCCMTSDGSLISDMSYCSGYRGHRSDLSLRVRKSLNYISLFVHPLTSEVSWVTPDLYWEHIKSQIDVELWFSWTPRNYYCTVPSQLDVTSMDFLSLKAALSAAGGFFFTHCSPWNATLITAETSMRRRMFKCDHAQVSHLCRTGTAKCFLN